jgi:hypothetical protein
VCGSQGRFTRGQWEVNASWYDAAHHYANFLVIGGPASCKDATRADAKAVFGAPARSYRVAGYTVLVWHENLLPSLG